jgi:Ca-activated chloride channel homolog
MREGSNTKAMKRIVITLLHVAILLASISVLQAQTRTRGTNPPKPAQPASAPPQRGGVDEVLRVTTNLVTFPFSVRSNDGKYLFDLQKENFRVFEDGVEQQIGHFTSVEQPIYAVLLVDTSASTEPKLPEIKAAVQAFISNLRQRDSVLPVAFDGQVRPLAAKGTSNRVILNGIIEKIKTDTGNNGTKLYDAIEYAYQALKRIPGRKAIILFSDGDDTWSKATMKSTLCATGETDSLIYPIQYGVSGSAKYLQALASETGGRFYQADDLEMIRQSFAAVAEELRRQYSIGYYPKTESSRRGARTIRVEIDRPDAEVMMRKTSIYRP